MQQKPINSARLIKYLKLFKQKELSVFLDFLNSPIYNTRKDVVRFFQFLKSAYPDFQIEWYRKDISVAIYETPKNKELSLKQDNKVRNLMSRLTRLIESFFVHQKYIQRSIPNKRLLIDSLMERKSHDLAFKKLDLAKGLQENADYLNIEHFYNDYRLAEAEFYLDMLTQQRTKKPHSDKVINRFQEYFITNLLLYYCVGINLNKINKRDSKLNFLSPLLKFLPDYLEELPSLTKIYFHVLQTLREENGAQHFEKGLTLVNENIHQLSLNDQRNIFSFLINFCAPRIRSGVPGYREYRFEIYQKCIEQELWITNSWFPAHHYIVHVKNMTALGKFEETRAFMDATSEFLRPTYRQPIPALCRAITYFFEGQLEEAHDQLIVIDKMRDYLFVLFQKTLTIQLFLAKNELQLAESHLHSLKAYLGPSRNRKISKGVQKGYHNFTSFALRYLTYRYKRGYHKQANALLVKLHKDVLKSDCLYEREWLISVTETA